MSETWTYSRRHLPSLPHLPPRSAPSARIDTGVSTALRATRGFAPTKWNPWNHHARNRLCRPLCWPFVLAPTVLSYKWDAAMWHRGSTRKPAITRHRISTEEVSIPQPLKKKKIYLLTTTSCTVKRILSPREPRTMNMDIKLKNKTIAQPGRTPGTEQLKRHTHQQVPKHLAPCRCLRLPHEIK